METVESKLVHGCEFHEAKQWRQAEHCYREALQAAPTCAQAWHYLGRLSHDQGQDFQALNAYTKALQIQPDFPEVFNDIGRTMQHLGHLSEAIKSFDQALALKPDYVDAYKHKGVTLTWEGDLKGALQSYRQALALDSDDPKIHQSIGHLLLLQGHFLEGWPEFRWAQQQEGAPALQGHTPLWDGSSLDGKTILLQTEEALGKTVHWIRFAGRLKETYNCRVILIAKKAQVPLLQSYPGIDSVISRRMPLPASDFSAPLEHLAALSLHSLENIPDNLPYLFADPALVKQWREALPCGQDFKVGLAWQNELKDPNNFWQPVALKDKVPLGQLKGVTYFSLLNISDTEPLDALAGQLEVVPLPIGESSDPLMDTAAILQNLDLLITTDATTAHLAGALGTPVWLILPSVHDWCWFLERKDSPWYPKIRLFRQTNNDQAEAFQQIAIELEKESPHIHTKAPEDYHLTTYGPNRLSHTRHGLMLYNRNDTYVGRSLDRYGEYTESELEVFRQLIREGDWVIEAGANIGAHTIVLSQMVGAQGRVYAFEPQRLVHQILCANLALNTCENVHAFCQVLGKQAGSMRVPLLSSHEKHNFGGLSLPMYNHGEPTTLKTVDSLQLPRCDVLKADVEGMELDVLQGATTTIATYHPMLFLENDRQENSPALIKHLLALDYNLYWHVRPMFNPNNYFKNSENVFEEYKIIKGAPKKCLVPSRNMLGIHASVKLQINGFPRITSPEATPPIATCSGKYVNSTHW